MIFVRNDERVNPDFLASSSHLAKISGSTETLIRARMAWFYRGRYTAKHFSCVFLIHRDFLFCLAPFLAISYTRNEQANRQARETGKAGSQDPPKHFRISVSSQKSKAPRIHGGRQPFRLAGANDAGARGDNPQPDRQVNDLPKIPRKLALEMVEEAKAEIVRQLIDENRGDVALLTPSQVMGLLNVNHQTLSGMNLPRIEIIPKRVIRYRLSDIRAALERRVTE